MCVGKHILCWHRVGFFCARSYYTYKLAHFRIVFISDVEFQASYFSWLKFKFEFISPPAYLVATLDKFYEPCWTVLNHCLPDSLHLGLRYASISAFCWYQCFLSSHVIYIVSNDLSSLVFIASPHGHVHHAGSWGKQRSGQSTCQSTSSNPI